MSNDPRSERQRLEDDVQSWTLLVKRAEQQGRDIGLVRTALSDAQIELDAYNRRHDDNTIEAAAVRD